MPIMAIEPSPNHILHRMIVIRMVAAVVVGITVTLHSITPRFRPALLRGGIASKYCLNTFKECARSQRTTDRF